MKIKHFVSILLFSISLLLIFILTTSLINKDVNLIKKTEYYDNQIDFERNIFISDTDVNDIIKDSLIDINSASIDEFTSVKGLSYENAKKIINLRKYQNKIFKFEDLLLIDSLTKKEYKIICSNFRID